MTLKNLALAGSLCLAASPPGVARAEPAGDRIPVLRLSYQLEEHVPQIHLRIDMAPEQALDGHALPTRADNAPCQPALPRQSFWLAIPWGATPSLGEVRITPGRTRRMEFERNPDTSIWVDGQGDIHKIEAECPIEPESPSEPVRIRTTGVLRDFQLVLIDVFPGEHDSVAGEYQAFETIHAVLDLDMGATTHQLEGRTLGRGAFELVYRAVVTNIDDAYRLGFAANRRHGEAKTIPLPLPTTEYEVSTSESGLHVLDQALLRDVGLPVATLDPRPLRIHRNGHELAIRVEGEDDASFDEEDRILFWAWAPDEAYEIEGTCYLSFGKDEGLRMAERDATPWQGLDPLPYHWDVRLLEKNYMYVVVPVEGKDTDYWFWEYFYAGDEYDFNLDLLDTVEGQTASLAAEFYGASQLHDVNPDHHIVLELGEETVADLWWDGQAYASAETEFSSDLLFDDEQENLLYISEPGDVGAKFDLVYLNWIEITYPAVFAARDGALLASVTSEDDVIALQPYDFPDSNLWALDLQDRYEPVLLTGWEESEQDGVHRFHLEDEGGEHDYAFSSEAGLLEPVDIAPAPVSTILNEGWGADLLIVTHEEFEEALKPLISAREAAGLGVAVVTADAAFRTFSCGIPTPEAIRDLVSHALQSWEPAPSALLLVGDATLDIYGNLEDEEDNVNFIPTFHVHDTIYGQLATDDPFATVLGDDDLPDLAVGRIPADSIEEVEAYVANLLAYEEAAPPSCWARRSLLVADDEFGSGMDEIAENLPDYVQASRLYLDDCAEAGCSADEVNAAIAEQLDEGVAFVAFVGHGGYANWTSEGIWWYEDIEALDNAPAFPMLAALTCLNGYFDNPWSDEILAEGFLTGGEGRGTIGVMAMTRGLSEDNVVLLGERLTEAIYVEDITTLGPAVLAAKLQFIATYISSMASFRMTMLFGDPTAGMKLPSSGDLDGSGRVDGVDLIMLSSSMGGAADGACSSDCCIDLDGDGQVEQADLEILLSEFGVRRY